jgi:hypothetical protein
MKAFRAVTNPTGVTRSDVFDNELTPMKTETADKSCQACEPPKALARNTFLTSLPMYFRRITP